MRVRKALGALLGAAVLAGSIAPTQALAEPNSVPAWSIQTFAAPTNFVAGEESGVDHYELIATNSGGAPTDGSKITVIDTLPKGLTVKEVHSLSTSLWNSVGADCKTETSGEVSTVTCTIEEGDPKQKEQALLHPTDQLHLQIDVAVPPLASGPLVNQVEVKGGGAEPATGEIENQVSEEEAPAGFEEFHAELTGPDGKPITGAASHPFQFTTYFGTNLALSPPDSELPYLSAEGDIKGIEVALPPGLSGNPSAVAHCSAQQFNTVESVRGKGAGGDNTANDCPDASAVGILNLEQLEGVGEVLPGAPLYNMIPPKGMPAQFAAQPIAGLPIYINTRLRSNGDYGVTAYLSDLPQVKRFTAAKTTFWGTPADPRHDTQRGRCERQGGSCSANLPTEKPLFRLPSSCQFTLPMTMQFDTWLHPGSFLESTVTEAAPLGCDKPDFSPRIEAKPTTNVADAPSGLHVDLHLPQKENEDPKGLGEADLRDATVTLPEGLLVNPSSADGLAGCTEAQVGYEGLKAGRQSFSAEPANCPDAAKIGTVEIDVPAIEHPLPGAVYLAQPHENPFNSLLAIYITVDDPQSGVVVKLPGEVKADPLTGQLTTTVTENPQQPFEDFKLDFFEGARAPLRTPATCGTHTTTTSLTPWSAPASGPDATPTDSFQTTVAPGGGTCPTSAAQLPNSPNFEAGTQSPIAGAYSPFVLHLGRPDGSQEFKRLNVTLPPGLTARIAGVAECPQASLAAAEGKSGKEEQASPSCPASSQLGTVSAGAGAGPAPFYTQGHVYLAGPYKGAPLSLAVITPALAGPFDLGTVVVRSALQINPETAQASVTSDPLPSILDGIPLDLRSLTVAIDRSQFTLNPTSCEAKAISGELISVSGQSAPLSNHFQVGGCQSLGFKPKLALALKGGTKRGDHPALSATLTYPKGSYANIAAASVALPHSEFLDQGHIGTVCTRVQFAANQCPARSVYGYAKAITPLLDAPLQGPVYLRSSSNQLPDLVADLNGQIDVVLAGRVDSIHGGIRNTFEAVPDAPVSKFTLSLQGGKKGLLENSTNLCDATHRATARFTGQNGKLSESRPPLAVKCKKHPKRHGKQG